jgi:hypothetical protein
MSTLPPTHSLTPVVSLARLPLFAAYFSKDPIFLTRS